jgi:hypothetical protein
MLVDSYEPAVTIPARVTRPKLNGTGQDGVLVLALALAGKVR